MSLKIKNFKLNKKKTRISSYHKILVAQRTNIVTIEINSIFVVNKSTDD